MGNFLGSIGGSIAVYAVVTYVGNNAENNLHVHTMRDITGNVLVWESDDIVEKSNGKHYFLVEGKVADHVIVEGEHRTIVTHCDCEQVGEVHKIFGDYYGNIGEEVQLPNATASFRRTEGTEWKITGEYSLVTPESEYRMIVEKGDYTFILPFDSIKRIKPKETGKYNIYAKVIGYTLEGDKRATFLYPTNVECKNGPFYGTLPPFWWMMGRM